MAITDPTDITGLIAWKSAKDESSITVDGSDNVTQWNDQDGTNHYTDIIGTPKSGTRTHNGHNVIDFDGSSAVGEYGSSEDLQDYCIAWCGIVDDTSVSTTVLSSARANDVGIGIQSNNWSAKRGAGFVQSTAAAVDDDFVTVIYNVNGTSSELYVDGVDVSPTFLAFGDRWRDGLVGGNSTVTASPITGGNQFMDGATCEIVAYSSALSSTDVSDLHDYFVDNWASAGASNKPKSLMLTGAGF